VEIPLFRAADITREIDLIEEIARIYGYGNIVPTMPSSAFPGKKAEKMDAFRNKVAHIMVGCGLFDVQTYSMLGPKDFEKCGLDIEGAVRVDNPMNPEESLMRTNLLPGLLNVIQYNLNRQMENVFVFEIGKIYMPSAEKLPIEKWVLCAAATGSPFMSAIDKGQVDYFYLKGILDNLLSALGIKDFKYLEADKGINLLQPGRGAQIEGLGMVGELHPDIQRNYDLEKKVCFFEIDLDELFKRAQATKKYKPLPKFPSVARDIAMFVPKGVSNQDITSAIRQAGGDIVSSAFLFDKYKDSLAYRIIFQNPERTLTDAEVNAKHEEISKALESKLAVRIRK